MITFDMGSVELAALIVVVLVVVYNLRNARWWRSTRPRLPW